MRIRNRRVVLEMIERDGPISRADLARQAGLSMPSVSEIVADLLASGLVVWSGEGASTGGRRPLLLRFNPARAAVLAADLGDTTAALGLFLLDGTCLSEVRFTIPGSARGREVVRHLVDAARRLWEQSPAGCPEVLGMGVAAPGVTDPETGEVTLAPAVGWAGTPVRYLLEQELGIPVVVDNDVNAAALAEWRFGGAGQYGSFVFVSLGTGVGMGIVLAGRIHRGFSNHAGEIGYMVVETDSDPRSGEFGQLESKVSLSALAADYGKLVEASPFHTPETASSPVSGTQHGSPEAGIDTLMADYRSGNPLAIGFLRERVRLLARAILNVYLVLAPEAIVIGGPVSPYADVLLPLLEEEVFKLSPFRPKLVRAALRHRAGLIGACALACDRVKEMLIASHPTPGSTTGIAGHAGAMVQGKKGWSLWSMD